MSANDPKRMCLSVSDQSLLEYGPNHGVTVSDPLAMSQDSEQRGNPETFEEALAWAKSSEAESGKRLNIIANPSKGLSFDLENSTITRAVWDEDNNLIEMTYCALTGRVLGKKVTKPTS
jgi:hypothetical protein